VVDELTTVNDFYKEHKPMVSPLQEGINDMEEGSNYWANLGKFEYLTKLE
jgi:hypothetical protein